ncbi:MAG: non-homologous end-joining DNA ligase [Desulfobulbaceae bacterium]|nr:non-homologous end-joining DNA ligase [Desulfobulbaceae bacterium]
MSILHFGRYKVETSHEDKFFFAKDEITKGDLIEYYRKIAKVMLPYMKDRPLMMHRYPDGIEGNDFYHKDVPDYFPSWIRRVSVPKKEGKITHAICNNAASLVYMADQASITFHLWLSRSDRLHYPDRMIFDLDPGNGDFAKIRMAAIQLRDFLRELGLKSFAMTTGSRGIHVTVPLLRKKKYASVRGLARRIADSLAQKHPVEMTTQQIIRKRQGRLFIDTNRNAYAQTSVAPYSVRARASAPIAVPIHWHEVENGSVGPRSCTIGNIFQRLGQTEDPWSTMRHSYLGLAEAERILVKKGG